MKQDSITLINNCETDEYFFSSTHSNKGLPKEWVPVTYYLPYPVVPRDGYNKSFITDTEDMKLFQAVCGNKLINDPRLKDLENIKSILRSLHPLLKYVVNNAVKEKGECLINHSTLLKCCELDEELRKEEF